MAYEMEYRMMARDNLRAVRRLVEPNDKELGTF